MNYFVYIIQFLEGGLPKLMSNILRVVHCEQSQI